MMKENKTQNKIHFRLLNGVDVEVDVVVDEIIPKAVATIALIYSGASA